MLSSDALADVAYREEVARSSYYRQMLEEAALDAEHHMDASYHCLSWESLSAGAKRPYQTAVAEAFDVAREP